ncbi:MAG: hypothetical protein IJT68_07135 [Lentisphaeria bacterium]|nr:hypothetical protein [Lentisphaeria bacterium]
MAISLGTALTIATAVAATTAIVGGVVGGVAGIQQHNQARANAEMQAEQAEYNKRLEEREASRLERENDENARRQREQSEYLKAQQRALLGKSGAAMTSGSPLAILGATAMNEELKVQDAHVGGYQAVQNHREQAKMYQYQAGVARAQKPSGSSLALSLVGQAAGTTGKVAGIAGNYVTQRAELKSNGLWGRSIWG